MKLFAFVILGSLLSGILYAQNVKTDSLESLLEKNLKQDTIRVNLLTDLAYEYQSAGSDRSLSLAREALKLSRTLKYHKGEVVATRRLGGYYYQRADYPSALKYFNLNERLAAGIGDSSALAWALNGKGTVFHSKSDYPQALQNYLRAVKIFEKIGKQKEAASIMGNAGVLYKEMGQLASALAYYKRGLSIQEQRGDKNEVARFLNNIGGIYSDQAKFSLAKGAYMRSLKLAENEGNKHLTALVLRNLLEMEVNQKDYPLAYTYGYRSLSIYRILGEKEGIADVTFQLALAHLNAGKPDSALHYARESLQTANKIGFIRNIHNTYNVLAQAYAAKNNFKNAYQAQKQFVAYKDSLTGEDQQNLVAGLKFQYELDKKQSEIEMLNKDRRFRMEEAKHQRQQSFALLLGFVLTGSFAIMLIRNNRQKQKANLQLQEQKEEIQHTLSELKSTQSQLVQREKMASLGELTAGIAHEIQNPLNFVNNFSQVSEELLEELKAGLFPKLRAEDKIEAEELIENIAANLMKINHHGKRADSIVKGMLQHSRSSNGQKELTDINALTDEFLRLSYHGIRAKEKTFHGSMNTDYDPGMGKIYANPSDLGRVLLNLFSNAFYSVSQKQKRKGADYEPVISVTTLRLEDGIEIRVRDNGIGIPQPVVDKIFQPFFTTKPSGQGTGLGLSLSYDIITKGHGGQLKVESLEDGFAEFIIQLPIKKTELAAKAV